MNQLLSKIADHIFSFETCSSELMSILRRNFYRDGINYTGQPDLKISIEDGYGVPFVNYEVDITKNNGEIQFRRADYLIEVDEHYNNAKVFVHDVFALKHALTNLYSAFIVYHNWGLLIHSSCVIEQGECHIFSGHSGAGKSTAAKLSYPRELLSDEATIVKITPDEITIYDSPFRSELESNHYSDGYPLSSIQILHQAQQNSRVMVKKSDALCSLMDKVFYWQHNPEETKKVIRLLSTLVKNVPVHKLHFQMNNTFWELIS